MNGENPIERAFNLARSGACGNMSELEQRLKREGYTSVLDHLKGPSIRRQLQELFQDHPKAAE
jgi:hypothetical protein